LTKSELNQRLAKASDQEKVTLSLVLYEQRKHKDHRFILDQSNSDFLTYADIGHQSARRLSEPNKEAQTLAIVAFCHYNLRAYETSLDCYFQSRDLYTKANNKNGEAFVDQEIANMFFYAYNDHRQATKFYERSAHIYEIAKNPIEQFRVLNNTAEMYYQIGNLEKAVELFIQALNICESSTSDLENIGRAASIRGNLAEVYFVLGDEQKAYDLLQYSLDINRKANRTGHVATALSRFGDFAKKKKEYDKARNYYIKALDMRKNLRFLDKTAYEQLQLGDCLSLMGDYSGALSQLEQALDVWKTTKDSIMEARTLLAIGQTRQRMGLLDMALHCYEQSKSICEQLDYRKDLLLVLSQMIHFHSAQNNAQEAMRVQKQYNDVQNDVLTPIVSAKVTRLLAQHEQNRTLAQIQKKQTGISILFLISIAVLIIGILFLIRHHHRLRIWAGRIISLKDQQLHEKIKLLQQLQEEHRRTSSQAEDAHYKTPAPRDDLTEMVLPILFTLIEKKKIYLDSNVTLKSLASQCKTNTTTLSRIINEKMGLSFSDFINHYRIEEAKKRLHDRKNLSKSIINICFEVGFNSVPSFYRVFHKHTGMSPTQFQKDDAHLP